MADLIIGLLKEIERDSSIQVDGEYYKPHPLTTAVIYLANEHLADNYDNIHLLKKNGYNVFAGEQDRFGWLTGCIQLKKGIIVFG